MGKIKKTNTILDKIIADKNKDLQKLMLAEPLASLKREVEEKQDKTRDFYAAVSKEEKELNLIAEIKKASPSAGLIRKDFDPKKIARIYQNSGQVSAISVITESNYFQGNLDFIRQIKEVTQVAILRKDFIFDPYQVYESRAAGADAILLIVATLQSKQLKELIELTHGLGMDALVETHTQEEIKIAVTAGAKIIGVNARNLKTFKVDIGIFAELFEYIPDHAVKVAESGLTNRESLEYIRGIKGNAVLIGTSLMKADDIPLKIKELSG